MKTKKPTLTVDTSKPDILAKYYPKWYANCVESARWLRSAEYEEFFKTYSRVGMLSVEEREKKAAEYESRAALYKAKME